VWQVAARGLYNDAPRIFLLVVGDCCCHNSQVHWYIEEDQLYFFPVAFCLQLGAELHPKLASIPLLARVSV